MSFFGNSKCPVIVSFVVNLKNVKEYADGGGDCFWFWSFS